MRSQQFDYIIVGAGIAGVTLASHLHRLGKRLLIFRGSQKNISSYVAAGLYNPITGRKMVKTWMADELFSDLEKFYRSCEQLTGSKFLLSKEIYRPFVSAEEQNEWMGKSADKNFVNFINQIHIKSTSAQVNDDFGGLSLNTTGFVNIPEYIESMLVFLSKHHTVSVDNFNYKELELSDANVTYNGHNAQKLIFCEGVNLLNNPYFDWLPLRPVKGELLLIRAKLSFNYILNRGVFVIPIGDDVYKVGSTYDHHDLTLQPTEKGKKQILEKLEVLLDADLEVVDHIAGLRPATKDRRPFVGIHPKYETIGVFNGLGTKGVSLAPYWSDQFVQSLEHHQKLNDEVNISRYFSLYSDSHSI